MTPAQTRDALVAEMRKAAQVESERSWEGAKHGADEFTLEQWADRLAALPVGDGEPVAWRWRAKTSAPLESDWSDWIGLPLPTLARNQEAEYAYAAPPDLAAITAERDALRERVAAFFDEYDRHMQSIGGCSDGYCFITGRAKGMHTNGGCNCWDDRTKARRFMNAVPRMLGRLRDALAQPGGGEEGT